jgi:tetratricopeptide (TPR) repeat protein
MMLTVAQALAQAVQQHQAGQLQQAEQLYRAILQVEPQQVDALHLLGLLAHQVGQHEFASVYIGQAVRLRPDFAAAHNHLGAVLREQGKLAEAVASYQQALRHKPDYAEAHNNLGVALYEQEQFAEAQASFQQALRLRPDDVQAHYNLGNVLHKQGRLPEAVSSYEQALRHQPDHAAAHNNLGNVLQEQGKLEEARASLQQALRLQPDCAETQLSLGNVLQGQGQLTEAQACLQQALRLRPDYVEAYINLGNVLQEQGQLAVAQACYEQALRHQPGSVEAHVNRALAWLQAGDFQQGWPEYEWRWQAKEMFSLRFPQPRWDGSPLHGQTILLVAEQGLGDTLQFIRYAPLVQERGGCVLLACQPSVLPLVSRCPGIDRLLPQGSALPSFDVWVPLLSLPGILGTSLATIPAPIPYLFPDAERIDAWRQELSPSNGFKIGIAWDANPRFRRLNYKRCIPLAEFAPLGRLEDVRLFSLQKGPGAEQLRTLAGRFPVTDLGSRLDEGSGAFLDTAAVMQSLDLVVTADISIAHLAGAMGLPVWVALPLNAHWTWLREREDSPWYPSMRLFRQQEWGNWAEVFARLAAALQQRLAQGSGA